MSVNLGLTLKSTQICREQKAKLPHTVWSIFNKGFMVKKINKKKLILFLSKILLMSAQTCKASSVNHRGSFFIYEEKTSNLISSVFGHVITKSQQQGSLFGHSRYNEVGEILFPLFFRGLVY